MAARFSAFLAVFSSAFFAFAFSVNAQQNTGQPSSNAGRSSDQAASSKKHDQRPPKCSLAKTNNSCALILDRKHPIAPPIIQMYSDQSLTVILENPNYFERYFMDYQSGQATLKPDVSALVPGLLTPLGKFVANFFSETEPSGAETCDAFSSDQIPSPTHVKDIDDDARRCARSLYKAAIPIYRALEPFAARDTATPDSAIPTNPADANENSPCTTSKLKDAEGISACITDFLKTETAFSVKVSAIPSDPKIKQELTGDPDCDDALEIAVLTQLKTGADAIANDLLGYQNRIKDVLPIQKAIKAIEVAASSQTKVAPDVLAKARAIGFEDDCSGYVKLPKGEVGPCVVIEVKPDESSMYSGMVSRSISYSLTTYNMISNPQEAVPDPSKKKQLEAITINFADSTAHAIRSAFRWEGSAGTWFSTLPMRSFTAGPVFTNGTVTNKTILQNVIHPMVIPFAAANYRLTNDLKFSRWKTNLYWTTAAGINPNTVTTDFGTGLSFSYRSLVISNLAHFGHDVRLAQGLTTGESLGAGFNGSIPTHTYWAVSYGFGLSIRIPALTGR